MIFVRLIQWAPKQTSSSNNQTLIFYLESCLFFYVKWNLCFAQITLAELIWVKMLGHKSDLFNLSHSGIDQNMRGSVPDLDVSEPLCMVPDSNMNFSPNQK